MPEVRLFRPNENLDRDTWRKHFGALRVKTHVTTAVLEAVNEANLIYVTDGQPGITRRRSGKGFVYRYPDGSVLRDPQILRRIKNLVIPPAYRQVWICPDERGHLQATGLDARGRKQYRYHPLFRQAQDQHKFQRMLFFGQALPRIRAEVTKDLSLPGLPKRKVLAAIVYLLEKSLIRIGNPEYAESNDSYGLTTLQTKHVRVQGADIVLDFVGKSHIQHRVKLHDAKLAKLIRKLQELPGQDLFCYVDSHGSSETISSGAVNDYLAEIAGERFTAKDFRTWWGTVLALNEFAKLEAPASQRTAKSTVSTVMKSVSKQLRNTPAVCRKCYVHPCVVNGFLEGNLASRLPPTDECDYEALLIEILCDRDQR